MNSITWTNGLIILVILGSLVYTWYRSRKRNKTCGRPTKEPPYTIFTPVMKRPKPPEPWVATLTGESAEQIAEDIKAAVVVMPFEERLALILAGQVEIKSKLDILIAKSPAFTCKPNKDTKIQ